MCRARARLMVLLAIGFTATVAHSQSQKPEGVKVRIEGAWARRAPMMKGDSIAGSGNGAVYLTIVNSGSVSDDVIAASSDAAASVELHESYEESGMMMMRPMTKLRVPAGGKLEMKPGGYHIMLINLKRELKAGQVINLTLVFQKAGIIPVKAKIK
jgi:periplasmic copper chaperone A